MPTPTALDLRHAAATGIVREAGLKALDFFRRRHELVVEHKGTQDVVSIADRAAEDHIVGALQRLFPEDRILGEEGGFRGGDGECCWIIDPIDGTSNFLHGIPHWCVSVGMAIGSTVEIGLVYDPNTDEMFSARRGQGAFRNGMRMKVSGESEETKARFGIGYSFRRPAEPTVEAIGKILAAKSEWVRGASGTLGLTYVADGRSDGYWEHHINAWDVAAGMLLVTEAGGKVNDFLAGDGLHKGNEIICATPGLFDHLSRLTGFGERNA
ncbi:inositol monophosphatase family protein [Lacibacterium aquatile]|uniref:Inositol-1-monophosphatase n=1 Tax=Lacibacterium aquatile TaxID=1168082 RepID=A0ABW5DPS2_9PROT